MSYGYGMCIPLLGGRGVHSQTHSSGSGCFSSVLSSTSCLPMIFAFACHSSYVCMLGLIHRCWKQEPNHLCQMCYVPWVVGLFSTCYAYNVVYHIIRLVFYLLCIHVPGHIMPYHIHLVPYWNIYIHIHVITSYSEHLLLGDGLAASRGVAARWCLGVGMYT